MKLPDNCNTSHSDTATSSCIPNDNAPKTQLKDVLQCQISSWYSFFAKLPVNSLNRKKGTIRTILLDLPEPLFRDFLLTDGVHLPMSCPTSTLFSSQQAGEWSSDDDDDDDENKDDDDSAVYGDDNDHNAIFSTPAFVDLNARISQAIKDLGGSVVPKLNWSCPKDAVWVNGGTLQCLLPGDVFLLLKSSDFCLYDVLHAVQDVDTSNQAVADFVVAPTTSETTEVTANVPLQLALRKWCNLNPAQEFRCFVFHQSLIACCQRHDTLHFPHLRADRHVIRELLSEFYYEIIQCVATHHLNMLPNNYCFDAYIDQDERVWLIDVNVWGKRTDTLLFTWSELTQLAETGTLPKKYDDEDHDDDDDDDDDLYESKNDDNGTLPILRIVETAKQVRPDSLASYRAPLDTLHVAGMASNGPESSCIGTQNFEQFMKICVRPSELNVEGDETDDDDDVRC